MKTYNEANWDIMEVLAKITDRKTMSLFLKDLLTPQEFEEIHHRWQIIKLLNKAVTQREIAKKLNVAIATITRGSRALKNPKGGFNKILKSSEYYD